MKELRVKITDGQQEALDYACRKVAMEQSALVRAAISEYCMARGVAFYDVKMVRGAKSKKKDAPAKARLWEEGYSVGIGDMQRKDILPPEHIAAMTAVWGNGYVTAITEQPKENPYLKTQNASLDE